MVGIKEGTFYDEPWVFYVSNESLNSTPGASIVLYVNYLKFRFKIYIYITLNKRKKSSKLGTQKLKRKKGIKKYM